MNYLEKKRKYKERQNLYDLMRSLSQYGDTVVINEVIYEKVKPFEADHVFIWFNNKPRVCYYYDEHKAFLVGNQQCHISNPAKKTNRVIEFVRLIKK